MKPNKDLNNQPLDSQETKTAEVHKKKEPKKIKLVIKQPFEKLILGLPVLFLFLTSLRKKVTLKQLAEYKEFNLDDFEALNMSEILSILNFSQNLIEVSIDIDSFNKGREYMKKMNEHKKEEGVHIIWMIENGASKAMILEAFPALTEEELSHWYFFVQEEGVEVVKAGRVAAIPHPDFEFIAHKWHVLQSQPLAHIDKLKHLKEEYPQYTLARLNTVIKAKDI